MAGFYREVIENPPETLLVRIPPELRGGGVEVLVLPLAPRSNGAQQAGASAPPQDVARGANGWPLDFFERTFSALPELEEIERPGPEAYEEREALE